MWCHKYIWHFSKQQKLKQFVYRVKWFEFLIKSNFHSFTKSVSTQVHSLQGLCIMSYNGVYVEMYEGKIHFLFTFNINLKFGTNLK